MDKPDQNQQVDDLMASIREIIESAAHVKGAAFANLAMAVFEGGQIISIVGDVVDRDLNEEQFKNVIESIGTMLGSMTLKLTIGMSDEDIAEAKNLGEQMMARFSALLDTMEGG